MKLDLLHGKKSIHIKLPKELHSRLREKLFRYGIAMQDIFEEIAEMTVSDSPKSEKFLLRVMKKKMKSNIEKTLLKKDLKDYNVTSVDTEVLYSLLEGHHDEKEE